MRMGAKGYTITCSQDADTAARITKGNLDTVAGPANSILIPAPPAGDVNRNENNVAVSHLASLIGRLKSTAGPKNRLAPASTQNQWSASKGFHSIAWRRKANLL